MEGGEGWGKWREERDGGSGVRLRATVCSLIIHELSLIHYFAKSVGRMELSFKVLCKIDKYYNQVKF